MGAASACKNVKPVQQETQQVYREDLSDHRSNFDEIQTQEVKTEPAVILTNHITAELDSISKLITYENRKPRTEQGFAIQIYNGSSREEATNALGRIRLKFPDIKAQMVYFQPDFKVRAGKFLDRVIAYETYEKVRREFPEALLVPEKIKINYD